EEIALEARNINKYNPDNTGNMGRYYFTIAQIFDDSYYERAIDFFKKATVLAPQNTDYYNLVGQAYYAQGQYDNALEWYEKAVTVDDRYQPSWLYKGDTHVAKSQMDEALTAHSRAIELNAPSFVGDNFDTRLNFYLSIEKIDGITEALQTYLDENPDANRGNNRGLVTWGMGHIHRRTGDVEEAIKKFEEALQLGYDHQRVHIALGEIYLQQENYNSSERAYQNALAKQPNLPQAYSSLGFIYARTGRLEEAITANQKVLESMPNDYDSNKNLALLNQQVGNLQEALNHAQTALSAAPEANKPELQAFINQVQSQLQPAPGN
ncbi:MAG: tetratricopeptide repeat protein, partial [Chloroflexota bacterium]